MNHLVKAVAALAWLVMIVIPVWWEVSYRLRQRRYHRRWEAWKASFTADVSDTYTFVIGTEINETLSIIEAKFAELEAADKGERP